MRKKMLIDHVPPYKQKAALNIGYFSHTLTGFLWGSLDMKMTGNSRCFFGKGTGKIMNGSKVMDTWKVKNAT